MQKQGLDQNLHFQKRWLLFMLAVSLAAHGLFLLFPGFSTPKKETVQNKILIGFQPQPATLPAVVSRPHPEQTKSRPEQFRTAPPSEPETTPTVSTAQPQKSASSAPATEPVKTGKALSTSPTGKTVFSTANQNPETVLIKPVPEMPLAPESPAEIPTADLPAAEATEKATLTQIPSSPESRSSAIVEAPPTYLDNPRPVYPPLARQRGWQGDVLVRVSVDQHGKVVKTTLQQSSGHRILDRSALKQIRTWKFRPAFKGETPVTGEVTVPVYFRLRQS